MAFLGVRTAAVNDSFIGVYVQDQVLGVLVGDELLNLLDLNRVIDWIGRVADFGNVWVVVVGGF